MWVFFSCNEQGLLLIEELGLWASQASVVVAQGLQKAVSVVTAHRLSCPATYGIFPEVEPLSPALADGLDHQENPKVTFFF